MKISLISITPKGVDWWTLRKGQIVCGHIAPDLPVDGKGNFVFPSSQLQSTATGYDRPFSDLPDFFDATPRLESAFRTLALREFTPRWCGLVLAKPTIAVHMTGYSRGLHLGEKMCLKDCIVRWGASDVILSDWPTAYTETQVREIVTLEPNKLFQKQTNKTAEPTAMAHPPSATPPAPLAHR